MRYVGEYETHLRAFDQPEFVEPPSFLREYETQVKHLQNKFYEIFLRMYNFQSEKWSKIKMKKILVVKIHYFIAFLWLNWCNKQH